ncbi:hypothetical protein Tco_1273668 [Tanacetum coccineum]
MSDQTTQLSALRVRGEFVLIIPLLLKGMFAPRWAAFTMLERGFRKRLLDNSNICDTDGKILRTMREPEVAPTGRLRSYFQFPVHVLITRTNLFSRAGYSYYVAAVLSVFAMLKPKGSSIKQLVRFAILDHEAEGKLLKGEEHVLSKAVILLRKETIRQLRQELVTDVELANNLLHELNWYMEQLRTRAPKLLRVEALPDDPLIKYGFSALERAS